MKPYLLIALLVLPTAFAYDYMGNVKVKFYDPKIDRESCLDLLFETYYDKAYLDYFNYLSVYNRKMPSPVFIGCQDCTVKINHILIGTFEPIPKRINLFAGCDVETYRQIVEDVIG